MSSIEEWSKSRNKLKVNTSETLTVHLNTDMNFIGVEDELSIFVMYIVQQTIHESFINDKNYSLSHRNKLTFTSSVRDTGKNLILDKLETTYNDAYMHNNPLSHLQSRHGEALTLARDRSWTRISASILPVLKKRTIPWLTSEFGARSFDKYVSISIQIDETNGVYLMTIRIFPTPIDHLDQEDDEMERSLALIGAVSDGIADAIDDFIDENEDADELVEEVFGNSTFVEDLKLTVNGYVADALNHKVFGNSILAALGDYYEKSLEVGMSPYQIASERMGHVRETSVESATCDEVSALHLEEYNTVIAYMESKGMSLEGYLDYIDEGRKEFAPHRFIGFPVDSGYYEERFSSGKTVDEVAQEVSNLILDSKGTNLEDIDRREYDKILTNQLFIAKDAHMLYKCRPEVLRKRILNLHESDIHKNTIIKLLSESVDMSVVDIISIVEDTLKKR